MHSLKMVYAETDEYTMTLELLEGFVFIHATLPTASKRIIQEMREVWVEILARLYFEGFDAVYAITKDRRMLKLFPGSKLLGRIIDDYEVVEWDLT